MTEDEYQELRKKIESGDLDIEIYQGWLEQFKERLLASGLTSEQIAQIGYFDNGSDIIIKSASPITSNLEAKGYVLALWLLNHADDPRAKEIKLVIENHLLILHQIESSPDTARGQKTMKSSRKGHEIVHGTKEQKQRRWDEYQDAVNALHAANPRLTYEELAKRTAKDKGVNPKTIKRHTTNPRKS